LGERHQATTEGTEYTETAIPPDKAKRVRRNKKMMGKAWSGAAGAQVLWTLAVGSLHPIFRGFRMFRGLAIPHGLRAWSTPGIFFPVGTPPTKRITLD